MVCLKIMDTFDPKRFAMDSAASIVGGRRAPKLVRGQRFLKGPIPWPWLMRAAELPGRALHTAVALWFLSGVTRSETVKLSSRSLTELGVDRHAKYRALAALERAGLVRVTRLPGQNPLVTLLPLGPRDNN